MAVQYPVQQVDLDELVVTRTLAARRPVVTERIVVGIAQTRPHVALFGTSSCTTVVLPLQRSRSTSTRRQTWGRVVSPWMSWMVPAGTATSGRALRGRVSAVLRLSSGIQSGILCEMHSWGDFAAARPDLAAKGRSLLYMPGRIGLGFLATTREDGGPRVHPICPLLTDDGLYAFIVPGPKLEDLHRDGRYALHRGAFPPPHHDDAFYVTGTAVLVEDPVLRGTLTNLFLVEHDLVIPWDGFEDQDLFELRFDRCLLTLTEPEGDFPAGHTLWRG